MSRAASFRARRRPLAHAAILAILVSAGEAGATHFRYFATDWVQQGNLVNLAGGLNDSGQALVSSVQDFSPLQARPFISSDGIHLERVSLPALNGQGFGLNALGHVAGMAWNLNSQSYRPFVTDNLGARYLPTLAGVGVGQANAINSSGLVVGQTETASGDLHATLWRNGVAIRLASQYGGSDSAALAIAENGHAVGWARDDVGHYRGFLWNGSQSIDLGTLGGNQAEARGINNRGVIVGVSTTGVQQAVNRAFIWRNGVMQQLGDLGVASGAYAINDHGLAVGSYSNGLQALAFVGGVVGMHDLNDFVDYNGQPPAGSLSSALAINLHGQILANRQNGEAVLLTPSGTLSWTALSGGRFVDGARWDSGVGQGPSRFLDMVLDSRSSQTVDLDENASTRSMQIGSAAPAAGVMSLRFSNGAVLGSSQAIVVERSGRVSGDGGFMADVINHGVVSTGQTGRTFQDRSYRFYNHGQIDGVGLLDANVRNEAGGLIRPDAGQRLRISGNDHESDGRIEVRNAELEWTGNLVNRGAIRLDDGVIRFNDRLDNKGQVQITFGGADVFGEVRNDLYGRIVASGGSEVTFWDQVTNDGEIRASAGAHIVYFGAVDGNGSFTTNGAGAYHRFEGGFGPGHSPAIVQMGEVQLASAMTMELGGLLAGSGYDRIVLDGGLLLDGGSVLNVELIQGFMPQSGQSFDLLDTRTGITGRFDSILLPGLAPGLRWDLSTLYADGTLRVVAVPEPQTWALMGLGLGLMGWSARRRRKG